jgi:hypothetical protein
VRCLTSLEVAGRTDVEIETEKSICLDFSPHFPQIGDKTTGLKIIRTRYSKDELKILVEGMGGREYSLNLITSRSVVSVSEAEVEDGERPGKKIKISFKGKEEAYTRKEIIIRFN